MMFKKNSMVVKNFLTSSARLHFDPACLAFFLLSGLCLAGCQTIPPLPPVNLSDPGWTVRQGQAVWRRAPDAPEIAGELLVAVNPDGHSFVQFTKTPLPFVVAQTTSNSWQINFVPNNKIYSAHGHPPASLFWLHLPACLAGAPTPKHWHWERLKDGGFRFQNLSTGEFLDGYLNP
jgi:hypothetical protein